MIDIKDKFLDLLQKDLEEYQKTGNIITVEALCHIIAYFKIRGVIISNEDIFLMLKHRVKYLEHLGDVYLDNGMSSKYSGTMDEISVINKYIKLYNENTYYICG